MRYDLLKRVMESRFVILLVNMKVCRIGECGEVGGGVGRSYAVIVDRGRREGIVGFGREVISVHDISFRGVATCDVIDVEDGVVVVKEGEGEGV